MVYKKKSKWEHKWINTFTRQHNLQRLSFIWPFIQDGPVQNRETRMKSLMLLPSESNIYDYFLYEDEWMNCVDKLAGGLLKSSVEEQEKEFVAIISDFVENSLEVFEVDLTAWAKEQLVEWFECHKEAYKRFSYYAFTPWAVDVVLAPRLKKELEKLNSEKADEWFEVIAKLTRYNEMTEQRLALMSLMESGQNVDLKAHIKKYAWLSVYDLRDEPWVEKDFRRMMADIKDPAKGRKDIIEQLELNKEKYKVVVEEIDPLVELRKLIDVVHWHLWLRDKRIDGWRKVLYHIKPFYIEIARRAGVELDQVVNLFNEEIIEFLSSGKLPADFSKRSSRHALIYRDGKAELINDSEEIRKLREKELGSSGEHKGVLRGQGAYPGVIKARTRVIHSSKDLLLLKTGEVLVAHHTSPDYIIAMKKAAAFVTDEGGITCHAAVVSRELKIPCVTAVADASKIIKTGDVVEVDADEGIVKIIEISNE